MKKPTAELQTLLQEGHKEQALPLYEKWLRLLETEQDEGQLYFSAQIEYAGILRDIGRADEAVELLQLIYREKGTSLSPVYQATLLANLANAQMYTGRLAVAEITFNTAMELYQDNKAEESEEAVAMLSNQIVLYRKQGKEAAAYELTLKVIAWFRKKEMRNMTYGLALLNSAELLLTRGKREAALACLAEAGEILRQECGEQHTYVACYYNALAGYHYELNNLPGTGKYLQKALAILDATVGKESAMYQTVAQNLSVLEKMT